MADATPTRNRSQPGVHSLLLFVTVLPGCAVEHMDASLTEQGGSDCPSSTGEYDTSTSTTTNTSSSSNPPMGGTGSDTSTSGEGTTNEGSESGSSTTGPMLPVCGDGVVEGDETCDDGNATPGDGCQECAKDSIVFITSEDYQGFAIGGLYGADQRCQSLAAKAELPRFLTFKAWLSTPAMSASARLQHSRGRYVLVNGLVVAQDWDALTSGTLENPIMVDEKSMTQNTLAWTGTLADGEQSLGAEFCADWDESGVLELGGIGLSASTDSNWSFFENSGCIANAHLYCVEQ